MAKGAITTGKIAPPVGPFSPGVVSDGMLYLSGQVAQDPASGKLITGDT
jgi:2-iminobutanoate/2-iminopropanoate deaminase